MKNLFLFFAALFLFTACISTSEKNQTTYCNPMDLSYRFCLDAPSRREAADPTMIRFKDSYLLFASKSGGYYHSKDLIKWSFIETNQIPTEEYAPTVVAIGDTLYFLASSETKSTIYKSGNPLKGEWQVALDSLQQPVWDPAFFLDEDGKLYLYWGCSNVAPTYGVEVDYKNNFKFVGKVQTLIKANPAVNGWEVPGDYNTIVDRAPWIEGSWVTKVNGKYYLQYAGPGTEFKSYSDGIYVSDQPLGQFSLQQSNPFCSKPEGFVAGGGHGSSLEDAYGNRWQVGCVSISKKHMFERRLAFFPVFCDQDSLLYANTKYGDYPMYIPNNKISGMDDLFTGWMLLSYNKDVLVSSTFRTRPPIYMVDEDIRTYWSAESGKPNEYAIMDLGSECDVYAIQVNFAEDDANVYGRKKDLSHKYLIECSNNGKMWKTLVDRRYNDTDNSHPYIQLKKKQSCRYLKITNVMVPSGNFAISGFRVFGLGKGQKPEKNVQLTAERQLDRRQVHLKWDRSIKADGYVVSYGVSKDKLYQNYMVYDKNELTINQLNANQSYVFTIEAFNENGITKSGLLIDAK